LEASPPHFSDGKSATVDPLARILRLDPSARALLISFSLILTDPLKVS
jgi:hypothetical protein